MKKLTSRIIAVFLALTCVFALTVPAFAMESTLSGGSPAIIITIAVIAVAAVVILIIRKSKEDNKK